MRRYFKCISILKKSVLELTSASLLNYLQYNGWAIIFADQIAGRQMLIKFGLDERAKNNLEFTATAGSLHLVITRLNLSEKEQRKLILHETGHILLEHNVSCLSSAEEQEADRFTILCLMTYSLSKHRHWVWAVAFALALFAALEIFNMTPHLCAHWISHCC